VATHLLPLTLSESPLRVQSDFYLVTEPRYLCIYQLSFLDFVSHLITSSRTIDDIIMAPRKLYLENQKASPKGTKAFIDAGVVKRRHKKVRFHENGLINVERKTGKYFKMWVTESRCGWHFLLISMQRERKPTGFTIATPPTRAALLGLRICAWWQHIYDQIPPDKQGSKEHNSSKACSRFALRLPSNLCRNCSPVIQLEHVLGLSPCGIQHVDQELSPSFCRSCHFRTHRHASPVVQNALQ